MPASIFPWLLLLSSFVIVGFFYSDLPSEVLIARGLFVGDSVTAPKTIFTAFRPPLIELICALAVEVMRRRNVSEDVRAAYRTFWLILLYTLGFKSLFQAVEIVSSPEFASASYYATLAAVVLGIVCSAPFGWQVFRQGRGQWITTYAEKIQLFGLLAAYLLVAMLPVWFYR